MSEVPEIQKMRVTTEEITYLVDEMAQHNQQRGPREADLHTSLAILAERYGNDHERCLCILERMRCLSVIAADERMRGWTVRGAEEGCIHTDEAIFSATSKCPLRADGSRVWFDPDEFFQTALNETEAEGRA